MTPEDECCEQIFEQTTQRDSTGRFIVKLPFISDEETEKLGDSREIAYASWLRVEKRLDKDPEVRLQYDDFMYEYIRLGHMSEIPKSDTEASQYVYLPHYAVLRTQSLTTKLRVVFNASSKTLGGIFLNDILCRGPKLQNDVADVISNWRRHRFVLTANMTEMFRQILVAKENRKYQCILWRLKGDSKV